MAGGWWENGYWLLFFGGKYLFWGQNILHKNKNKNKTSSYKLHQNFKFHGDFCKNSILF